MPTASQLEALRSVTGVTGQNRDLLKGTDPGRYKDPAAMDDAPATGRPVAPGAPDERDDPPSTGGKVRAGAPSSAAAPDRKRRRAHASGRSAGSASATINRRRGLLCDLGVIALITMLVAVYFYPLALGRTNSILGPYGSFVYPWASIPNGYGLSEPQTDYAELSYPWLVITDQALEENTVPLWSSQVFGGGYDLYANGSSALLYPPRLLALWVTSPVRAHDLFLVLHMWGAGVAMFLLARELGLRRWAGTFAAVAWMFATWNTAWMQLEVVTPLAVFMPATIATVHRAMIRRSARSIILAGLVCALAASSGHLLLLGTALFVAGLYAVALSASRIIAERRARRADASTDVSTSPDPTPDSQAGTDADPASWGVAMRPARHMRPSWRLDLLSAVAPLALLGVVAAGAAAVLLLPTALALRGGQRVPFSYAELQDQFLAEPSMLGRLVFPPHVPVSADDMQYLGFVGSSTVIFAAVGLLSRRRRGAWLARCLVVLVPLVMIGTPLTWVVWRFVPGMNVFRPYSRLIVFAAFGLVIAAGLGVQVVLDGMRRHRPRWQQIIHVGLALAILVTAGQLMYLGRRSNPPFVPHEARYALPPTALIEQVRSQGNANGWPARVMPVFLRRADNEAFNGVTLYANTAEAVGLDTMSGYDSSVDRRTLVMLRVLNGADATVTTLRRYPAAFLAAYESWSTRYRLLARLGVTHIVTTPDPVDTDVIWNGEWTIVNPERTYEAADGIIYRVPASESGPRLIAADEVVNNDQAALLRFTDSEFPAQSTVLVERTELNRTGLEPLGDNAATPRTEPNGTATAAPSGPAPAEGSGGAGDVVRAVRGVNTVSIDVEATRDAWLVLPDAWAPGWSATVNGNAAPVVRVNYYQRAVRVPEGTSQVSMRYRPPGLLTGAIISALTITTSVLAMVVLTVGAVMRRAPRPRPRPVHVPIA